MSHVSKRMRERPQPIPCEVAAMNDCPVADGEDFCGAFPDPDLCPKYRRVMIREGEVQRAGWEFNYFDSQGFAVFWLAVENEWAEQFKYRSIYFGEFGPPCDCGSSVCDECNPGWDQWNDEEDDGGYDY